MALKILHMVPEALIVTPGTPHMVPEAPHMSPRSHVMVVQVPHILPQVRKYSFRNLLYDTTSPNMVSKPPHVVP